MGEQQTGRSRGSLSVRERLAARRRLRTILISVVLVGLGAAGTLLRSTPDGPRETGGVLDATSSSTVNSDTPTAAERAVRTPGAAPRSLLPNLNTQRAGATVEDWTAVSGDPLIVAPLPTAVDRSALLQTGDHALSCRRLPASPGTLAVTFMVDTLPQNAVRALSVEPERDGAAPVAALELGPGGAMLGPGESARSLVGSTWYRWVVTLDDGSVTRLEAADGASLGVGTRGHGTEAGAGICVATVAPMRLYLDEVTFGPSP